MLVEIQVPYSTQPRMKRFEGCLLNTAPNSEYIKQKVLELSKLESDLCADTYESTVNQLVKKTAEFLQLNETDSIKDLALQIEEDIAIMHKGVLASICFCFPSSWIPSQRIGMTLEDIHRPVADGEKLVASSPRLAETMAQNNLGPFRRQVWTLTTNSNLSNHPIYKSDVIPTSINDLYLRVETQTAAPLGDNISSVFLVKVDVVPLVDVWPQLGANIRRSINSMTTNVLKYKNLENIKPIVNRVLLM